jgi:cytosine deaminase
MEFDLVVRNALVEEHGVLVTRSIGIRDRQIAAVAPTLDASGPGLDAEGLFVLPGFVESHLHLDKSRIADRCVVGNGSIDEAMAATRKAKADFTVEDIYERARATLEQSVLHGTTRVRTHVEVDPLVGLRGFEALTTLAAAYRWAADLEICVFAQDGLLNNPGTDELLVEALHRGASVVGGAPYADSDPEGQIDRIFELAREFDVDIDLHLDLSQSPEPRYAAYLCDRIDALGWEGRVTIGHLTQWSLVPPDHFGSLSSRLVDRGVGVTVLPATDLFLMGRAASQAKPRGVVELRGFIEKGGKASLATNNVLNPFTPYGDCSLVRIANLYANITHLATPDELAWCLELVSSRAADVIDTSEYGIIVGHPAHLVCVDAPSPAQASRAALMRPPPGGATDSMARPSA